MRCKNGIVVLGPDGRPLALAKVNTKLRPSGEAATVYAAETGGSPGANPAPTDASGEVEQWVERDAYSSTVTAAGMEPKTIPWDAVPGGDHGIDHDALAVTLQTSVDAVAEMETDILDLEAGKASYSSGLHSARPAAAGGPTFYYETDTDALFHNSGAAYNKVPRTADLMAIQAATRPTFTKAACEAGIEPSATRAAFVVAGRTDGTEILNPGILVDGQALPNCIGTKSAAFFVAPAKKWTAKAEMTALVNLF